MRIDTKIVEYARTFYIAMDGTEFTDQTECINYEQSAACAFWSRLINKSIRRLTFEDANVKIFDLLIDDQRMESVYFTFAPTKEEDITDFIGYCNAINLGEPVGTCQWWEDKKFCPFTKFNEMEVGKKYIIMIYNDGPCFKIINADKFTNTFESLTKEILENV